MKKIIALILSGILFPCIPSALASENATYDFSDYEISDGEVYSYDFEKTGSANAWRESTANSTSVRWCAFSGAEISQKIGGIGENSSNAAEVKKTDASSAHMYFNVLGSNIRYKSYSDAARYFKFNFKIYTSGEGVEYAAPCGTWQDAWAPGVSVKGSVPTLSYIEAGNKPIACLEKNEWNDVTYIIRLDNKHKTGNYIYFDTYSDIYVNGVQVAENRKYTNARSITAGMTDDDHVKFDFLIKAAAGQNFTAYIDDLSLRVYSKNVLKETQKPQSQKWEAGGEQAYYLADEDFTLTKGGTNTSDGKLDIDLYSWKLLSGGGFLQNYDTANYVPMRLNDTESDNHLTLKKDFEKQYTSILTIEYRFLYNNLQSGGTSGGVSLCGGDDEALGIYDKDKMLWCGRQNLNIALSENTEYGVRLEADMASGLAEIYIGGKRAAENIKITADFVDNIRAWTTDSFVGKMMFCPVRITRGYAVYEDFVAYSENQALGSGYWTADGELKAEKLLSHTPWDMYALKMGNGALLQKRAECSGDEFLLSYNLFSGSDINDFEMSGFGMRSFISGGKYYISLPGGDRLIKQLDKNVWNLVKVKLNLKNSTLSVYINGKELCGDADFKGDPTEPLCFRAGENSSPVYIDDIMLYASPIADEYYPSEPTAQKTDSALVGVQTCDLWREGKHYGWSSVNKYPSRKPYMGYYDDGSVEVKDWEIKYMAENGIDFAMYTWFAPNGVNGGAIKESRFSGKSFEAYFNARYKDKVKLAVMWENSGYRSYRSTDEEKYAQCLEHFENVLVPYWTEYYFSDPDYLKADGKLVFSIYKLDSLVSSFGSENAKAAVSFLRKYVKEKTGLDMYILGCTSSETRQSHDEGWASFDNMKDYKAFGFDGVYPYSYSAGQTTFGRQYNKIMALEANETEISDAPRSIPTVSMGRDPEAWTGDKGSFLTPKAFEKLLSDVKANYLGGESGIDNMIMLDNWNEYGEGHFITPTGIAGFGYLEAIARVFGAAEHINEKPPYPKRFCHLYSEESASSDKDNLLFRDEFKTVARWDFNSSVDGWTGSNLLGTLSSSGGALVGKSSYFSSDPQIYSPSLNITLDGTEVVHVRFSNASSNATTEMFFKTENSSFSQSQSVQVYCLPTKMQSGEFVDVYFDMSADVNGSLPCSAWKEGEKLTQLRIDPSRASGGTFEYDFIEILRSAESKQDFSARVNIGSDLGGAVFKIESPDERRGYIAWLAEYDRDGLVNVAAVQKAAEVGSTEFSLPYTFKSGRKYKAGLWDKDLSPLISPAAQYLVN